jgi:hypothetical protein
VERDHAGVVLAVRVAPGDALVGQLLGDLGVPLVAGAAELGDPMEVLVVDLADLLDALHELRELLELGPLVVRRLDRNLDFDALLDRGGHQGLRFVALPLGLTGRGRGSNDPSTGP